MAEEVRDFYEAMPYPPPLADLDAHRELEKNPDRRRALFHLIWPTEPPRANLKILIAGCGTSQAARYALREPEARITAIDISETSLRHTRGLQRKYDLENLELHRLPIESVGELDRAFDLIVCTGVLHHLPNPDLGLRALRDVLAPRGAMHLMVYARYGRAGIYMMQDYCRLLGIGASPGALTDLGASLDALPADHPLSPLLRRVKDFRQPDALADALLHPHDRAYTVRELYEWLERCGMSFGRWHEQAPYLPQCGLLATTPHTAKLCALDERAQHAAAELFRGTITQHSLIACRDDCPKETQPIHFEDEAWRNYIPIRSPGTLCVREGIPRGSAAVLLNPAHKHPDLALAINAAQYQLFDQIDGKRSLAEILRNKDDADDEIRGMRFFRRLWQYDQIIFDASHSAATSRV
jgi:SAM-dependent methyltransferase